MMAKLDVRRFVLAAALTATAAFAFFALNARPAAAQASCESECGGPTPSPSPTYSPSPSPTPTPTPSPSPSPYPSSSPSPYPPPPPSGPTGADSSGNSIGGLANQRFNQMITNRVLGTVLLGVNEQVNCSDCISASTAARS
jgi:hypothetical protein